MDVSIEREVFPRLVGEGLYSCRLEGYWMDIGTPERYLEGTFDILEGTVRTDLGARGSSTLIADGCSVAPTARVGGRVVLGPGVSVGAHTTIDSAVVLDGARIGADCTLRACIVGPGAVIGDGTRVDDLAMVGADATLGAHTILTHGAKLFPGVTIPDGGISF